MGRTSVLASVAGVAWRPEGGRSLLAGLAVDGLSGKPFSLRWLLLHMIEETARHNGHADLLREAVDGQTGE